MKVAPYLLAAVFTVALTPPAAVRATPVPSPVGQANDKADSLVGTWEGNGPSDSRAQQHIVLDLRSDGTYTKTLDSTVDGAHYGGTHSGTWKARGTTVYLSGDGNWPSSSHDLRNFRKVN